MSSIKPFQYKKDGRGAYQAMINQFTGVCKWEHEIKTKDAMNHGIKWKGQLNYSLEHHAAQHRNAYVSLVACAEHIDYQLPNEHSHVGYLLDSSRTTILGSKLQWQMFAPAKVPAECAAILSLW